MSLSGLQRYILRQCLAAPRRTVGRGVIALFYRDVKHAPSVKDQATAIAKSIERLVGRGLATSIGKMTAEKWFPQTITLTPMGLRIARTARGKQLKLPLR